MSATDELRRLLDERGVEWESKDVEGIPGFHDTRWNAYDVRWCYVEFVGNNYTKLVPSSEFYCTPEQAIAATLGSGKLTADDVLNAVYKHGARWQAIADELNSRADYHGYEQAAIEAWESIKAWNSRAERTCKFVSSKGSDYPPVCSACGYELGIYDCEWFEDGTYGYGGNYCPNCGCKVVDE